MDRDEALANMSENQKKIFLAKEKLSVIKQIDKLEKECAKLEKTLENKLEKIDELVQQL